MLQRKLLHGMLFMTRPPTKMTNQFTMSQLTNQDDSDSSPSHRKNTDNNSEQPAASFDEFLWTLPDWEQALLRNSMEQFSVVSLLDNLQRATTILLVSDGGALDISSQFLGREYLELLPVDQQVEASCHLGVQDFSWPSHQHILSIFDEYEQTNSSKIGRALDHYSCDNEPHPMPGVVVDILEDRYHSWKYRYW